MDDPKLRDAFFFYVYLCVLLTQQQMYSRIFKQKKHVLRSLTIPYRKTIKFEKKKKKHISQTLKIKINKKKHPKQKKREERKGRQAPNPLLFFSHLPSIFILFNEKIFIKKLKLFEVHTTSLSR